jgi:hypothetical protein
MKRLVITGAVLLAACGGTQVAEMTVSETTTTTVAPTTTTTTVAPTTTTTTPADLDEIIQVLAILDTFTEEATENICRSMRDARRSGLSENLIIGMGVESFEEGFGSLKREALDTLVTILRGCFR